MTGSRETATKERLARAGEDREDFIAQNADGENVLTDRLLDGSVLDLLLSRHALTGDQYHAGAQLYSDWYFSGLAPGAIDPAADHVDNSAQGGDADRKIDAMERYRDAIKAVGLVHAHVLTSIVLFEERLADYGVRRFELGDRDYARKLTIGILKAALDQLDFHYYGKRRGIYRNSHSPSYRPQIMPPQPPT